MNAEQKRATINRFRLHGFGHEQAVMMAEAIEFALTHDAFATMVGRFGIRHLQDAVESMPLEGRQLP